LGNLIAAFSLQVEVVLAAKHFPTPSGPNYAAAMAVFTAFAFAGVAVMTLVGYAIARERRETAF
jgi:hypothetical protein